MRYAGPREAIFHAIARKNYGITQLIVGRDHAGVGKYYEPLAAQRIFDQFDAEDDLGVTPLRLDPTFYCRACGTLASSKSCPHDASTRLELSGTEGPRDAAGRRPPARGVHAARGRGDPARALRGGERRASRAPPSTGARALRAPAGNRGFILWFTGLSGAGKSTLAEALKAAARRNARRVEILDGDEVRTHLSKGLGFSKEDRDTNIRRIGFVARLLARNGVVAIGAAISPYADTRDEVRDAGGEATASRSSRCTRTRRSTRSRRAT